MGNTETDALGGDTRQRSFWVWGVLLFEDARQRSIWALWGLRGAVLLCLFAFNYSLTTGLAFLGVPRDMAALLIGVCGTLVGVGMGKGPLRRAKDTVKLDKERAAIQ